MLGGATAAVATPPRGAGPGSGGASPERPDTIERLRRDLATVAHGGAENVEPNAGAVRSGDKPACTGPGLRGAASPCTAARRTQSFAPPARPRRPRAWRRLARTTSARRGLGSRPTSCAPCRPGCVEGPAICARSLHCPAHAAAQARVPGGPDPRCAARAGACADAGRTLRNAAQCSHRRGRCCSRPRAARPAGRDTASVRCGRRARGGRGARVGPADRRSWRGGGPGRQLCAVPRQSG